MSVHGPYRGTGPGQGAGPDQDRDGGQAGPGATRGDAPHDRARLMAGIQRLLDAALAEERPPEGLDEQLLAELCGDEEGGQPPPGDPPEGCDLYSLWSALIALSQEIKLQGRAFSRLTAAITPLTEQQERSATAPPPQDGPLLELLLDLRDRLGRGHETARAALRDARAPGRFQRLFAGRTLERLTAAAEAQEEGSRLTLARLDEQLGWLGVNEISGVGEPFNAEVMTVTEVQLTEASPEGTVLQVFRPGYTRRGEILRLAEVKVARAPEDPAGGQTSSRA